MDGLLKLFKSEMYVNHIYSTVHVDMNEHYINGLLKFVSDLIITRFLKFILTRQKFFSQNNAT
jgi:hypothetical protein